MVGNENSEAHGGEKFTPRPRVVDLSAQDVRWNS
jgi:hypothetical protein